MSQNNFSRCLWLSVLLFTAGPALPAWPAQPAERRVHARYLFILDTSANMKKREPAVEKALNTMLATSMNGQLHKGDTIGVWTFNQDLYPGDFPLEAWNPENAALIASNLTQFVRSRRFVGMTRFEALQPPLNRVMEGSERLTVLVFSDGATKITGTTFDTGINQLFEQNAPAQKKAREPFVVVLRSQQGKYVGCTVSLPPQLVSYPQFPPLPPLPEPPPTPTSLPVPVPAAAVVAPSIFITGTNVENHLAAPAVKPAPTNPPPAIEPAPALVAPASLPFVAPVPPVAVVPVAPANPPVAARVNPPAEPIVPARETAIVTATIPVMPAQVQTSAMTTNPVTAAVTPPAEIDKKPLIIGAVCLFAAGVLTILAVCFFRRPDHRSLISRSMHDK